MITRKNSLYTPEVNDYILKNMNLRLLRGNHTRYSAAKGVANELHVKFKKNFKANAIMQKWTKLNNSAIPEHRIKWNAGRRCYMPFMAGVKRVSNIDLSKSIEKTVNEVRQLTDSFQVLNYVDPKSIEIHSTPGSLKVRINMD